MSVEVEHGRPRPPAAVDERSANGEAPVRQKSLTIGAVCKQLEREFPDISISKIRYLEDQKLLSPRRTQGGYRLYAAADVDRLRPILRLQRDEVLSPRGDPPGRVPAAARDPAGAGVGARRARVGALAGREGPGSALAAARHRERPGR